MNIKIYLRHCQVSSWIKKYYQDVFENIKKCNKNFLFYKMRHKYLVYYLKKINANGWSEKKLEVLKYCKRAKNMEGMVLADVDLCESMLGMFIDIQPDYIYIVTIANRFSIEHVKKIYFE